MSAWRRVGNGETTWDELVSLGLAGNPAKTGPRTEWRKKADALLSKRKGK